MIVDLLPLRYAFTKLFRATDMTAQFDIFKSDHEGNVLWVGSATDLESAKDQVRALGKSKPGEYLILDQHTRSKIWVSDMSDPR